MSTDGVHLNVRAREIFGELMVAELKIAAARTGQVSNVPAFLTEHLRRRLWKKEKSQIEAQVREEKSEPARPKRDTSKCLDCGGTNMYYPDGYDSGKGVAKCRHERLAPPGDKAAKP